MEGVEGEEIFVGPSSDERERKREATMKVDETHVLREERITGTEER